jgi:hypothetical protein
VNRYQLALEMGGQFADLDAGVSENALYFVAVDLALGGPAEVEQANVPRWDLNRFVAVTGRPGPYRRQIVIGRRVGRELRQEYSRAL